MATAFEDAVEEGLGQVWIMEDVPPGGKGLIGDEDHGFAGKVAFVDDLEEDVGGVVPEGEVAHLVNGEDVGVKVVVERFGEPAGPGGTSCLAPLASPCGPPVGQASPLEGL